MNYWTATSTLSHAGPWSRILAGTKAPGIYFEDHPELADFECPEWSHLSAADSVEFTRRLVPHLRRALTDVPTSLASARN